MNYHNSENWPQRNRNKWTLELKIVVVQLWSHVWLFVTPWTTAHHASLSFYLPEFVQTYVHWVSDAIQSFCPLWPSSPPALSLSQHHGLFQWVSSSDGGQRIGASTSASVFPMNIQGWFPLGLIDLISLKPWNSQQSSLVPQFKGINSSVLSLFYGPTLTFVHDYWKNHSFDYIDLCQQVMSMLFNTLSRLVIAFLSRTKHLLISWLHSPTIHSDCGA